MKLLRHGQPISTIFDLLGATENAMTAGLAHILASSSILLRSLINDLMKTSIESVEDTTVRIQTSRRAEGITDIEVELHSAFFAIIEAKRGPEIPSASQLALYAPVIGRHPANRKALVTLSNATQEFARLKLNPPQIGDTPIIHRTWREVRTMVKSARDNETNANKGLLDQFSKYLDEVLGMENKNSNSVFVVSLSHQALPGWTLSLVDVVEKRHRYFFPVGKGWPDPPPNYVGFRFDGKLQSIRHVKTFSVFENPRHVFPEAADEQWPLHYCLELGPAIVPSHDVKNGPRIQRAGRCWCAIDTLLTAATISDALSETERRN